MTRAGSLPPERVLGIETGGCPHAAIREDASINPAAVAEMRRRSPDPDVLAIENGGDTPAAPFGPGSADPTIYVGDVSAGDTFPREGGPAITRGGLPVINKTDPAPLAGASLEVMDRDSRRMRGERPFVFTDIRAGQGGSGQRGSAPRTHLHVLPPSGPPRSLPIRSTASHAGHGGRVAKTGYHRHGVKSQVPVTSRP